MNPLRVVSNRPPYIPITLTIDGQTEQIECEAMIDTGFDGEVLVPRAFISAAATQVGVLYWRLADGSEVDAPDYLGELRVGNMVLAPVTITVLGTEPTIGRGVTQRFTVTFDHDRQVIVEP